MSRLTEDARALRLAADVLSRRVPDDWKAKFVRRVLEKLADWCMDQDRMVERETRS